MRNPVSFKPTGVFSMTTVDSEGYAVGSGDLDNIAMTEPSFFTDLTVVNDNQTNGATTDYTFKFSAAVPLYDGDRFNVLFPKEIKTPRKLECEPVTCLDEIKCSGEAGRVVASFVKLSDSCGPPGSVVSFIVKGLRNPRSLVESGKIGAYW